MRFIELENTWDEKILVNVHQILTMKSNDERESTEITMTDGYIHVKETTDDILIKIRG